MGALALLTLASSTVEAKEWSALGTRWAIKHDEKGGASALYDLSFPSFGGYLPLGVIGDRRIKTGELIKIIATAGKETVQDQKDAEKAINELSTKSEDALGEEVLPAQWWKTVPWNSSSASGLRAASAAEANEAPIVFAIGDINLKAASKNNKKFDKTLAEVNQLWAELVAANPEVGSKDWANHFTFIRQGAANTYELQFVNLGFLTGPKKMADFKNAKWGFMEAVKIKAIEEAISRLVGLLKPAPVVAAIVDTALDRYFHYQKLTRTAHQNMALELFTAIYEKDGAFAAAGLTDAEVKTGIESLQFASTSLTSSYKWIWKKPFEEFQKEQKDVWSNSAGGMKWLDENGYRTQAFNARFAFAEDPASFGHLLQLGMKKHDKNKGPFVSYDEENPTAIRRHRLAVELLTTAVTFGTEMFTFPVPFVSSGLRALYKRLVEDPVTKAKAWEARMTAQLEQRQASYGEDWSGVIDVLNSQRINPLGASREKTQALIDKRRAELGL